ncbi:MAG: hypothetical protein RBR50_00240 [Candidatus Izemoplasmatales bacterium]|nr:hypothetical protein [Candidatus Izemoplasmatales bacterium]
MLKKILNFLKQNAFIFINLIFTLLFVSLSIIDLPDFSVANFSSFLNSQKLKEKAECVYGEVEFSNNTQAQFYLKADNEPGQSLKFCTDTYFQVINGQKFEYKVTDLSKTTNINCKIFLYTPWNIEKFNYGYKIYGHEISALKNNELYITESVADSILKQKGTQNDYEKMENSQFIIDDGTFIIKGVLVDSSMPYKEILGSNYVLGSYTQKHLKFIDLKYLFMIKGNDVSTYSTIKIIENNTNENVVSKYFNFDKQNNKYFIGYNQSVKEKTIGKTKMHLLVRIPIAILAFANALLIVIYIHKNDNRYAYITLVTSYAFYVLLCKLINLININGFIINFFHYEIVTLSFVILLIYLLVTYIIIKRKKRKFAFKGIKI